MDAEQLEDALLEVAICQRDGYRIPPDKLEVLIQAAQNWSTLLMMNEPRLLDDIMSSIDICFNKLDETGGFQHKKEKGFIEAIQKAIYEEQQA